MTAPAPERPKSIGLAPGLDDAAAGQDAAKYGTSNPVVQKLLARWMETMHNVLGDTSGTVLNAGQRDAGVCTRGAYQGGHGRRRPPPALRRPVLLQPSCKPAITQTPKLPIRFIVILVSTPTGSSFPVTQRPLLRVLTPKRADISWEDSRVWIRSRDLASSCVG